MKESEVPNLEPGPHNTEVAPEAVAIGDGWNAALSPLPGGAVLRVRRGESGGSLEILISLSKDGPVLRARAAALEIETERDVVARCENFRIEARQNVEVVSAGTLRAEGRRVAIEATHGSAKVQANDNVQLLGENVLLNCEAPTPALPAWALPAPSLPAPSLPTAPASGDPGLVQELRMTREKP